MFVFSFDDLRVAHLGDFGPAVLRPEQRAAIGDVDLLFVPVGGGPTLDAAAAGRIVRQLDAAYAVPMHYRTPALDFLEPADAFLAMFDDVHHADGSE